MLSLPTQSAECLTGGKVKTLSRLHNSISLCQTTMLCLLFAHVFGFSKNNIRIKLKTAGKIVSVTKSNIAYLLQHLAHIHITKMTWMRWEIAEYLSPWKGCFYHVITLKTPTDNTASQQGLTLLTQARPFLSRSEVSVWQRAEQPVRWKRDHFTYCYYVNAAEITAQPGLLTYVKR